MKKRTKVKRVGGPEDYCWMCRVNLRGNASIYCVQCQELMKLKIIKPKFFN